MQKASLACQWEAYGPSGSVLPADGAVLLQGLQARPELNGTQAKVLLWDAPSGRFAVRAGGDGGERIKVRPSNLRTIQDTASAPWASTDHDWLLPIDMLMVIARCLSSRNVAVLSSGSRGARATLWLSPAAEPLWDKLLLRGFGPQAADLVRLARPAASGPARCRCARALRRLFQTGLEVVRGGVDSQAGGAEVVACPVLTGLNNAGIGAQGAVRHAAGRALEEAVAKLRRPLDFSSAVLVPGGPLAQHVALTVTEPPHGLLPSHASQNERLRNVLGWLERIHDNLLQTVRDSGCRTLAMPTLCTGGIGMAVHWVAMAAVRALHRDFCRHPADPVRVRVACFETEQIPSFNMIRDAMIEKFYRPEETEDFVSSLYAREEAEGVDFL